MRKNPHHSWHGYSTLLEETSGTRSVERSLRAFTYEACASKFLAALERFESKISFAGIWNAPSFIQSSFRVEACEDHSELGPLGPKSRVPCFNQARK